VYVRRQMNRQVDFDFLNRQLVWQGFTEFVLFLMPFISFQSVKSAIMRMLPFKRGIDTELPPHMCAICSTTTIHTPYMTNCDHTFWSVSLTLLFVLLLLDSCLCADHLHHYSYFCIKSNMITDTTYSCPRCGTLVESIQRLPKV
jgi:peroxin-2